MMRKSITTLGAVLLLLIQSPLGAQEFDSSSTEVRALNSAYLRAGLILPWSSYPLSRSRLRELALELEASGGRIPATGAFEPDSSPWSATGFVDINYDLSASAQTGLVQPDAPRDGIDLERAWLSKPSFARLGAQFSGGGAIAEAELDFKQAWDGYSWFSGDNNAFGRKITADIGFDSHILKRGILGWESGAIRAWMGRDAIDIGPAGFSSLFPSAALPYFDAARMQTHIGPFNFDWVIASFLPDKNWEGKDVDTVTYNGTSWGGAWWDADNAMASTGSTGSTKIVYVLHRLSYENGRLSLGIAEEQMYARNTLPSEVYNYLPFGIFHDIDTYPDNMTLVADFGLAITKGLGLRMMAGLDDFSSDIFGVPDSPVPTIPAVIGGADFAFDALGLSFEGVAEGGYTHYLWGNFDANANQSGYWGGNGSFLARMIARYAGRTILPLTSPYGPASTWARSSIVITGLPGGIVVKPRALVLWKNPTVNLITTPYQSNSGLVSWSDEPFVDFGLEADWSMTFGPTRLGFAATPQFAIVRGVPSAAVDLVLRATLGSGADNVGNKVQWW